jgi:hypothetical protein
VKYRWFDKSINILDVEKAAKSFLEQRGYTVNSSDDAGSKKIAAVLREPEGTRRVIITISGQPNDFIVDFSAGAAAQLATKFSSFITYFGGGLIQRHSLKEKEFYDRLEEQFWEYLEESIEEKGHGGSSV